MKKIQGNAWGYSLLEIFHSRRDVYEARMCCHNGHIPSILQRSAIDQIKMVKKKKKKKAGYRCGI